MGLDDEVGIVVSDLETQFMPQSDDEDELWEVIEITGERSKEYKVKWAGINEKTSKPWPQSWVPKHDCTDDLVLTWKAKKKELERRKCERLPRPFLAIRPICVSTQPRNDTRLHRESLERLRYPALQLLRLLRLRLRERGLVQMLPLFLLTYLVPNLPLKQSGSEALSPPQMSCR